MRYKPISMKKLSGLFLTAFIGLFSVMLFLSCSSDSSEENNKNKEPEPSVDNVESMARKLGRDGISEIRWTLITMRSLRRLHGATR